MLTSTLVPRRLLPWLPMPPSFLLVANLHAPTTRVDKGGHSMYRVRLPSGPSVESRMESLRRSSTCAPVLEMERTDGGWTLLLADQRWTSVVDLLRQAVDVQTRRTWMEAFLRLLLTLEQNQPWMAQLPFRPEHLEVRGSAMRLSVTGVAWVVQVPLRLQVCPLQSAADFLDTLFGRADPWISTLAMEWRNSSRQTPAEALETWIASCPKAAPRLPLWTAQAALAGAALAAVLAFYPHPATVASTTPHHATPAHPRPMHGVGRWLKRTTRPVETFLLSVGNLKVPSFHPVVLDLAHHALTGPDLDGLSGQTLTLMRNEIYARHGRTFEDPDLRHWFSAQPWYVPDPTYTDARLSTVERQNACFILDWQHDHHLTW